MSWKGFSDKQVSNRIWMEFGHMLVGCMVVSRFFSSKIWHWFYSLEGITEWFRKPYQVECGIKYECTNMIIDNNRLSCDG